MPGSVGRECQSLGNLAAKPLSPFVSKWDLGLTTRASAADLSGLGGKYQVTKPEMYFETGTFKALKVLNTTSKSILNLRGGRHRGDVFESPEAVTMIQDGSLAIKI